MARRDQIVLQGIQLPGDAPRSISLRLWLDLGEAAFHDRIERTVDYREVHGRVLAIAARRTPHLGDTIARELLMAFPAVQTVEVEAADEPVVRRRALLRAPAARVPSAGGHA